MRSRLAAFWQRHESFLLVLILFTVFRLLAVWLMRPGGFIADTSDYDFYVDWGEQYARGYHTFNTLWTAYPPLFAALMLPVYELSARIPPWVDSRLAFHSLFGALLLIFETGNLVLIYRLSLKLAADDDSLPDRAPATEMTLPASTRPSINPVIFYALLFVPVHTMLGWFEAMPLFFLLLALDLLLTTRRWTWTASSVALGLGFLVKLTPIILLPIAIRWLGARLSWQALRHEWFNPRSAGNLLRPFLYILIALATILGLGYLLVGGNTSLAFSSFTVNAIRPPWQSLWALIDGYWSYGWVPVDMRNLGGLQTQIWQSRLPWTWITLAFVALYLWLYTRNYNWTRVRTAIAFTGVSTIWMFLYSKGWSPQFLVWILAFIALLMPNLRGVLLAVALTLLNIVEAYLYLILLPDEHWILVATVSLRTLLLVLTAVEFLVQIWRTRTDETLPRFVRWSTLATWVALAATLIVGIFGAPLAAQAYSTRRLAENPCFEAIEYLREQGVASPLTTKIATTEIGVWRNLYPWLRDDYDLRVIDGYSADDTPADAVISQRLAAWAGGDEFWWVYTNDAPEPTPQNLSFFDQEQTRDLERNLLGDCHVERIISLPDASLSGGYLASAAVDAGPKPGNPEESGAIEVQQVEVGDAQPGSTLPVVLYWQATGNVPDSWTVFTQLFDAAGNLIAQQDNLPVQGLAPTNTWQTYHLVRDPYTLSIPAAAQAPYSLQIGLYNVAGERAPITLADGTKADHFTFEEVDSP